MPETCTRPTRPLKQKGSCKDFTVQEVSLKVVSGFIAKHHYSHNVNGLTVSHCFALYRDKELIGAMLFGSPGMPDIEKAWGEGKNLLELRRLVCIDDTPKNTESRFISLAIKWLRDNTKVERIISYADKTFGHTGVIYQASNFRLVGESEPGRVISFQGKTYHDKAIRTTYKGKPKPYAVKLRQALDEGKATYQETKGKNIYLLDIKRKRQARTKQQGLLTLYTIDENIRPWDSSVYSAIYVAKNVEATASNMGR